ncbi:MAG: hypothetical protein K2X27_23480 [Candidatus Obscuribacterales bacterium]|nr:hypothetical protein [Candidatus Obscuribacterales bacterium]
MALSWMQVLNEHSEWRNDQEMLAWLGSLTSAKDLLELDSSDLQLFKETLSKIRRLVYDRHFGKALDLAWLNQELSASSFFIDWPPSEASLPLLRAGTHDKSSKAWLNSLRSGILIDFASDLAGALAEGTEISVQRCEGLYRDSTAEKLSSVPDISNESEVPWRQEIPVLLEKELDADAEIQRCADLFPASSRSKYCSDKCRFNTFQIVKQLKDPSYLAEKQRRYRKKKS